MEHPELESTTAAAFQPDPAPPGRDSPTGPPSDPPSTAIEYGSSGRRLLTWDELPPKVRLRAQHEGQWVAWSADQETIVASAEQFADLHRAVKDLGTDRVVYEWIDLPHRRANRL